MTRKYHWIEQTLAAGMFLLVFILFWLCIGGQPVAAVPAAQQPTPELKPDRLAIPTLPPNPSPVDLGRSVYYYNCMPCHGDRGQGLTDEWRTAWVEDHQNCWARGCHGGRVEDQGFPLPKSIPALIGGGSLLSQHFPNSEDLLSYLKKTHPPQRPGALEEAEYRSVTEFLFYENQQAFQDERGSVESFQGSDGWFLQLAAVLVTITAIAGAFIWQTRQTNGSGNNPKKYKVES